MITYVRVKGINRILVTIGVLVFFLNQGCRNAGLSRYADMEGAFLGRIGISAGDDYDFIHQDSIKFMAFPMNVATLQSKSNKEKLIYIIGKSIKKDQVVPFRPIALLEYETAEGEQHQVVIGKPLDKSLVTAEVNTYFELISLHYGIQKMIETWVKNVNGFGTVSRLRWEDEKSAEDYLIY